MTGEGHYTFFATKTVVNSKLRLQENYLGPAPPFPTPTKSPEDFVDENG